MREDLFDRLACAHPAIAALAPNTEALLVFAGPPFQAWVVSIDRCFELTARLRGEWQGITGGEKAKHAVRDFFDALARSSEARRG